MRCDGELRCAVSGSSRYKTVTRDSFITLYGRVHPFPPFHAHTLMPIRQHGDKGSALILSRAFSPQPSAHLRHVVGAAV